MATSCRINRIFGVPGCECRLPLPLPVRTSSCAASIARRSVVTGRRAIEAAHEEVLTGSGKGSRHSHPGTPKIRFIRHDVAIVDGDSFVGGLRDKDGKELPAQLSYYIAVFVKEDGRWLVTAFRSLPQVKPSASAH